MTARAAIAPVRRRRPEGLCTDQDLVAVESPLDVSWTTAPGGAPRPLGIVMRTPGDDRDLVAGLLHAEGLVTSRTDILSIALTPGTGGTSDAAVATLASVATSRIPPGRVLAGTSACGLCGRLEMIASDPARACRPDAPRIDVPTIDALPGRLRHGQAIFDETGGLHAAGLLDLAGSRALIREDVGRHNAVDKVIGAALEEGWLPAREFALAVSGRVAYEIVQKAVMAGIPLVVAVGAPSSLSVEAARAVGLTLVGFARDARFNIYAGWDRVIDAGGELSAPSP